MTQFVDTHIRTLANAAIETGAILAGRYEIQDRIGSGGMGVVLRVIDRELNNEVIALKLLHPHLAEDENVFKRFRNEVLVARSLTHPNIVRTYDIGRLPDGLSCITMEYVNGTSLRERLATGEADGSRKGRPIPFEEAIDIFCQILSGVAYAHGRGVIHRDLKPANVLINRDGEIKLADFGTARILGMDTSLTQAGQVIGTPDYMSPEQIRGERLDLSCDIYSLGIIAYEIMVGTIPFEADSAVAVAFKHLNEPLPTFSSQGVDVPSWYEQAVIKAVAKDKAERFAAVADFASIIYDNMPGLRERTGFFTVNSTSSVRQQSDVGGGGASPAKARRKPRRLAAAKSERDFELGSPTAETQEVSWTFDYAEEPEAKTDKAEEQQYVAPRGTESEGRHAGWGANVAAFLVILLLLSLGVVRFDDQANRLAGNMLSTYDVLSPQHQLLIKKLLGLKTFPKSSPDKIRITAVDPEERAIHEKLQRELLGLEDSGTKKSIAIEREKEKTAIASGEQEVPLAEMTPEELLSVKAQSKEIEKSEKIAKARKTEGKAPQPASSLVLKAEKPSDGAMPDNPAPQVTAEPVKDEPSEPPAVFSKTVLSGETKTAKKALAKISEEIYTPPPVPSALSANMVFRQNGKVVGPGSSLIIEDLDLANWLVVVNGVGSDVSQLEAIREEFVLNIFDPVDSRLIARLKSQSIKPPNEQEPAVRLSGSFEDLKGKVSRTGLYRADFVRSGEFISSKEFSLGKARVSYSKRVSPDFFSQRQPVRVVTGPAVIEPSGEKIAVASHTRSTPVWNPSEKSDSSLSPESPVEAVSQEPVDEFRSPVLLGRDTFNGIFRLSAAPGEVGEAKSLILRLQFRGVDIEGDASIDGFGMFDVRGRVLSHGGWELFLKNDERMVRLTAVKKSEDLFKGRYQIPADKQRGSWEVRKGP